MCAFLLVDEGISNYKNKINLKFRRKIAIYNLKRALSNIKRKAKQTRYQRFILYGGWRLYNKKKSSKSSPN